jgi:hypothetical protein
MQEDIISGSNEVTEALSTVRMEECADEIAGKWVDMVRPVDLALKNLFIDSKCVIIIKWL